MFLADFILNEAHFQLRRELSKKLSFKNFLVRPQWILFLIFGFFALFLGDFVSLFACSANISTYIVLNFCANENGKSNSS